MKISVIVRVHLQLGKRAGVILDTERRYSHNVKAVALLEPEGESLQLAQAYVQLGDNAVHGHGDRSSGLPLMEKGLALAERLGDTAGVIEAARWLGHALVYHTGEIQPCISQIGLNPNSANGERLGKSHSKES
ncbi:MAG TPA: hypothetical protein VFA32_07170, partial [Dehalococcoidia bacterium]|nr:hypothetical protein [Dehalococcoidia bacterium]